AGVGSRVAMFVLRLTSDESVIGVVSDDEFTIGQFTLFGTFNLLVIGAAVGVLGAAVYQWVRPWLIGPRWLRLATVSLGSGAVVGSMLVHADGVDFRLLTPTWLAIGFFVALPAIFGLCVAVAVDSVSRPSSWTAQGRTRWILPVVLLVPFPLAWFVVVFAAMVLVIWVFLRDTDPFREATQDPWLTFGVRALWLGVAVLGLLALIGDVRDIQSVT
ncbi:MAG TPA: hypothetical protein VIY72_11875, partial [Acidimicrobiales bacterium]